MCPGDAREPFILRRRLGSMRYAVVMGESERPEEPQEDVTVPTTLTSVEPPAKTKPPPPPLPAKPSIRPKSGLASAFPSKPATPAVAPSPSVAPSPPSAPASASESARVKATPSLVPPGAPATRARTSAEFQRSRTYAFAVDDDDRPVVLGSGRFARLYLGYERREESASHQERAVVIKMLQKDLEDDDVTRFRQEKSLLEYLQGHPSIVELLASGTIDESTLPDPVKANCEGDFLVLEKLDMTLQERVKGSRDPKMKEDLAALGVHERLLRVLEYVIPVASAVEFAHLVRNVCHRDINPSNVFLKLPDPKLAGGAMQVRLGDFSAARRDHHEGVTRIGAAVPGTTYFQSPEQETNLIGLLVDVKQGSRDVEYFEDFFVDVAKNDTFALVNRDHEYVIREVDRAKKRIVLETPFAQASETQVRARVQKRVGRPADIYAVGALLYYLMSGASRNPKALNDTFRKFDEYDRPGSTYAIEEYLRSEYDALEAARSRSDGGGATGVFRYQHFLDANDEPIPFEVMRIVARCMIRNKEDSYCASDDLDTTAITDVVRDLLALHSGFGLAPVVAARVVHVRSGASRGALARYGVQASSAITRAFGAVIGLLRRAKP